MKNLPRLLPLTALLVLLAATPLSADDDATTIGLPHDYSQFTVAGGGRYLIFHYPEQNTAGVFDMITGKSLDQIEQVAPGDLLAGAATKLFIVSPARMTVRRWDLKAGKRDKVALLKSSDAPRQALTGCSANAPLLVVGERESQFIDPVTLKSIDVTGPTVGGHGRYGKSVHVSADGRTFASIPKGYGPVAYSAVYFDGNRTESFPFAATSNAIRWAQPTASGYLLMRPEGGVTVRNGRTFEAAWLKGGALVSATEPGYFIDVRVNHRDAAGKRVARMTFCSTADCRPLLTETGFDELVPRQLSSWHDIAGALRLGHQWRVQYIPSLNLLITIPAARREIVIRRFDLFEKLKAADLEHLYVSSIPPLSARPGKLLVYDVRTESSSKKVTLTLEDGPQGAALKNGLLRWRVPVEYAEPTARFLLTISNSTDEIFHSFEVAVRRDD